MTYYNEISAYPAAWLRNLVAAELIAPGVVDERYRKRDQMTKITLNKNTRESAADYVEAIMDACKACKIKNPLEAIENTDAHPALARRPMVEFAAGWLRGVADALGVEVAELWAHVAAGAPAKRARRAA